VRREDSMTSSEMAFRLIETSAPEGEVGLNELGALCRALQDLATRIGRQLIDQRGPGRTKAAAEVVTRIRLTGISAGSTTLTLGYGQPDVLDVEVDLETETRERFESIVAALGSGNRPDWVDDAVALSAISTLEALQGAARRVEFRSTTGETTTFAPSKAVRAPWRGTQSTTAEMLTVSGRLEAVDLLTDRFRVRDDVGNAIPLEHVANADIAAQLIARRVSARGAVITDARGQVRALESPVIDAAPLPREWVTGENEDWSVELAKPGPDPTGGAELTDDEFAAFLTGLAG
jgi:hypothetical protein